MVIGSCVVLGAVSLRVDTVKAQGSAESSTLSVQGVRLSVVKALTETMEPCCPSAQTPNPVLSLSTLAICYHVATGNVEVACSYSSYRHSIRPIPSS